MNSVPASGFSAGATSASASSSMPASARNPTLAGVEGAAAGTHSPLSTSHSSSRSRKRARNQGSSKRTSNAPANGHHPAADSPFASLQHPHGPRSSGGTFHNQQMPPPSNMHPPPGHVVPSTGMGWGIKEDDDPTDFILDDLDRLTPRDIAVARFKRNHELLNIIFDARRIDTLAPMPSTYASRDQEALRAQLQQCQQDAEKLQSDHAIKAKRWQDEHKEHESVLHAPLKRVRLLQQQRQEPLGTESSPSIEPGETNAQAPQWATNAGRGAIVGVGFVRAKTPEEVRALLPKPPPPPTPTPAPAAAPAELLPTSAPLPASGVAPGSAYVPEESRAIVEAKLPSQGTTLSNAATDGREGAPTAVDTATAEPSQTTEPEGILQQSILPADSDTPAVSNGEASILPDTTMTAVTPGRGADQSAGDTEANMNLDFTDGQRIGAEAPIAPESKDVDVSAPQERVEGGNANVQADDKDEKADTSVGPAAAPPSSHAEEVDGPSMSEAQLATTAASHDRTEQGALIDESNMSVDGQAEVEESRRNVYSDGKTEDAQTALDESLKVVEGEEGIRADDERQDPLSDIAIDIGKTS